MTAPRETKTVRVCEETHQKINHLVREIRGTADEVLTLLLADSTVHVPLTAVQYQRWERAAAERGVNVQQLVKLCVEAAIQGPESSLIERTYYLVRAIVAHHGISPTTGLQQSIDGSTEESAS